MSGSSTWWRAAVRSLAVLVMAGSGAMAHATASTAADCRAVEPVPWQAVAPGVWVWLPPGTGDVSPANAGHVVPTSVVLGGREAMVIDPGPSHRHGLRLRQSIECRFKARVRWIVNTHAHSENVLANSAFEDLVAGGRLDILATAATREGMAQRCPDCLASLTQRVGEAAMAGTRIVLPNRTLAEGDELRVGALRLRVMRVEQGHTEGDLVLWNPRHRLLWAGGLIYQGRVPELAQGRVDHWLAALTRLEALRPRQVLSTVWSKESPGVPPPALAATRHYLQALRDRTLQAMDEGAQPQEIERVNLPAFQHWEGYAARHGFNVQRAWRELEPVWMDRATPAK
jgi:glyoxylase-like metal-dependent hydrolase (beta-lactamase superfamily II)